MDQNDLKSRIPTLLKSKIALPMALNKANSLTNSITFPRNKVLVLPSPKTNSNVQANDSSDNITRKDNEIIRSKLYKFVKYLSNF